MKMIQKNINLVLLFLIVVILGSVIAMTLVYQQTYEEKAILYKEKANQLDQVMAELNLHKARLNETTYQLQIKSMDTDQLNELYESLTGVKGELEKNLKTTGDELTTAKRDLVAAQLDASRARTDLNIVRTQLEQTQLQVTSLASKVGSYKTETSRLDSAMGDVFNKIDAGLANAALSIECKYVLSDVKSDATDARSIVRSMERID